MEDLAGMSVLIVDAQAGMRTTLKGMLTQCGVKDIDDAPSANLGLKRLLERRYDIVICEYHLGEGQDGQHFLEDARAHKVLPLSTIFLMVTGESSQQRVVGTAELAPSDYILKPFAADTLRERIERTVRKRAAFLPAWEAAEAGNAQAAVRHCAAGMKAAPQYAMDFLRLKAELHLALGEAEAAQAIYRQVADAKAVPWARLGLAKSLFMQKRHADAAATLESLVAENTKYLDAYDWLARVKEAAGDLAAAHRVVRDAVSVSPHAVRRLRRLGEVSLAVGDAAGAEKAIAEVVRKGKYSEFRDPEDHVLLVKSRLSQDDADGARDAIRELEKSMKGLKKTAACAGLSSAMVFEREGDDDKAKEMLEKAVAAGGADAGLSESLKLDIARGCMAHDLEDAAGEMLEDVMRNAADERVLEQAKSVLKDAGKEALAEKIAARVKAEVVDLLGQGAAKAQSGDYDGAVGLMLQAAAKMPGNVQVAMNAALALLKHVDERGWNEDYAAQARGLLERVRTRDPGHARLSLLGTYYDRMLAKYGIRTAGVKLARAA